MTHGLTVFASWILITWVVVIALVISLAVCKYFVNKDKEDE